MKVTLEVVGMNDGLIWCLVKFKGSYDGILTFFVRSSLVTTLLLIFSFRKLPFSVELLSNDGVLLSLTSILSLSYFFCQRIARI